MSVKRLRVQVIIEGEDVDTDATGETIRKPIRYTYDRTFLEGTGSDQLNIAYFDSERSLPGSAVDLDLAGSLTDPSGTTQAFVEAGVLMVHNKSLTVGQRIDVGGGGANSVNGATAGLNADADEILIGADGLLLLVNPLDGARIGITAATGDILRLDPGSATFNAAFLVAGTDA